MQIEITVNIWFGNSVLWNRMYSAGENKRDTDKGRKFNPKRIIKWLREVWDRR
jgi:hypothetical protein